MARKKLTLKIFSFLVFIDLLETLTNFCFKKSTFFVDNFHVASIGDLLAFFRAILFSPFLWVGLLSVAATFIIWSTVLSKIDLSVAVPVCSFSYITIAIVSIIFLHEKINMMRWLGIFFILAGVTAVSLSSKEKEARP